MKQLTKMLIAFGLLVCVPYLQAQRVIPVTGGNGSGAGGSVSYTVGQIDYIVGVGTGGSLYQGVQYPFEISVSTSMEDLFGVKIECIVYPNPVTDFITLKIEADKIGKLGKVSIRLFDLNGVLIKSKDLEGAESRISFENLASGTYLLKVSGNNKEIKTFKIIKH